MTELSINEMNSFRDWCIMKHEVTNHMYNKYIPYRLHLEMVVNEVKKFSYCENSWNITQKHLICAAWGHDLIEDCRVNYTEILERAGKEVAEIVFAVTDVRGRNRSEKHAGEYWWLLKRTSGAAFIKCADRLANVKFSVMMNNTAKLEMYRKEWELFKTEIETPELLPMITELEKLLEI